MKTFTYASNHDISFLDPQQIELDVHELIDLLCDGDGETGVFFYRYCGDDENMEFIAVSDQCFDFDSRAATDQWWADNVAYKEEENENKYTALNKFVQGTGFQFVEAGIGRVTVENECGERLVGRYTNIKNALKAKIPNGCGGKSIEELVKMTEKKGNK